MLCSTEPSVGRPGHRSIECRSGHRTVVDRVVFFFFFTPYIPWVTQYPIPHAGTTPSKTLEQPHLKRWNNLQQNAGTTCTSYRKDAGTITKRSWNSVGSALEHPHSGSPSRWNKHDNRLWNKLTLEHPHSGTLLRWNTLTLEHSYAGTPSLWNSVKNSAGTIMIEAVPYCFEAVPAS